ncbi:MAG: PAS domain S-box protein [candidate division WOR-3 bacterium]|nr:MAG: PAS domain S-box protein [candidate division WOR-3 bacterium]
MKRKKSSAVHTTRRSTNLRRNRRYRTHSHSNRDIQMDVNDSYKALFDNSCVPMFLTDQQARIIEVNKAAALMTGYSNKELVGNSMLLIYPKNERKKIMNEFKRGIRHGGTHLRDLPLATKKGAIIFVETTTNIIESDNQKLVQVHLYDITHHVKTEEDLRKTIDKLNLSIEGSDGFPWECEFDQKRPGHTLDRIYLSPGAKRIIGYSDREMPSSIRAWYRRIVPEDIQKLRKSALDHLHGKSTLHQVEYRIRHRDGSIRWIRSCGRIAHDAAGRPERWIGIHWDVSQTRETVKMLSESERRYRSLVESLPDIVWSFSLQRGIVYSSPRVESILGYTPNHLYKNPWLWMESIHPDDQHLVTKAIADFTKNKDFAAEYRIKDVAGKWHWFLDRFVARRKSGHDVIIEGVSTDISERIMATAQLRLNEESYRELADSITDLFFEMDHKLRYTYWNKTSENLIGVSANDAIGKTITEIFPKDKPTLRAIRFYRRVLKSQKPATFENEYFVNGTKYFFEINAYPSTRGISVIAKDITSRKEVEETVKRRDAILAAVSSVAEQFLRIRPWTRVVNNALQSIANAAGVCRAYVYENHLADDGTLLTSKRYEWTGPSCDPQLRNPLLQNTTYAKLGFARWPKILSRGESIHSPVNMLPATERKQLTAQGVKSIAIMPIFVGGQWWGFTGFNECRHDKYWSNAEIEALKAWAEMLSSALHRRDIEARIAKHSAEQVMISNIARIVGSSVNLREILERLLDKTMTACDCGHGAVYLLDRESGQYSGFIFRGVFSKRSKEIGTLRIDARKMVGAIASRHPISMTDSRCCPILWRKIKKAEGLRTVLLVPLPSGNTIKGVLALAAENTKNYDDRELNLFSTIGRYAGHAIEKARLYNSAQRELTERRSLEKELRQSEAKYRTIFDTAPDAILTFDVNGKVTSCNKTVRMLTGFRVSDFVGHHFSELPVLSPSDIPYFEKMFSKAKAGKIQPPFRVTWMTYSGEKRIAELRTSILKKGKKVSSLQIIARDITESTKHELMIKRRDAIFEAIAHAAEKFLRAVNWTDVIQDVLQRLGEAAEVSRTYIFQNRKGRHRSLLTSLMYEWTTQNTTPQLNNPLLKSVPYRKGGFERWSRAMSRGSQIIGHVRQFPPREREILLSQEIKSLLTVPIFVGDEWWGFIGFDECRYEREWSTAAIEALKIAANEIGVAIQRARVHDVLKYQADLLDDVSDAIISTDLQFRIISWNKAAERMYGWKAQEVIGKTISDITHIKYPHDKIADVVERFFEEGFWNGEVMQRHKDGRPIDVLASVSIINDGNGKPVGAVAVNRDITARKRAAMELQNQHAKLQKYLDISGVVIVVVNSAGKVELINKKGCRVLGLKEDEIVGRDWVDDFIPARFRNEQRTIFGQMMAGEYQKHRNYINPILTNNGEERTIHWYHTVLTDEKGRVTATLSSGNDITEQKKAEEALIRSEAKYRRLIENTNVGIVSIDTNGALVYVNQTFCKMLGYRCNDLIGKQLAQFLHAEDRKATIKTFLGRSTKVQRRTSLEFRALHKDGQIVSMLSNPTFIKQGGKTTEIHAIIENISGRKEAEKTVRYHLKLENRLAKISEKLVKTRDVTSALDESLADLADLFATDRALLAQRDEKTKEWRITHEWHREGLSSVKEKLDIISEQDFFQWFSRIKKQRYVSIIDTTRLPKSLMDTFTGIVDHPPKSVLAIPLYVERRLSGILWLTAEKRHATWQKYDIEILQAAGDVIMASVFKDRYQKRLTRTLRDLDTERKRIVDLAKKTIEMQERERLYFASEIHDNLLQSLVAVLYYLQTIIIPESTRRMDEQKEKLVATIKSSIDSGRALIREIEPLHAPEISLVDAVRNSIETRFIDTDTKHSFAHPKRMPQMSFAAKINLLRIIQEAIMNVRKHAQAKNLNVSLTVRKRAMLVEIIDDGIGFNPSLLSRQPTGHLGLVTMQERARLIEGILTIKSEPGSGTRVTGVFPLSDLRK